MNALASMFLDRAVALWPGAPELAAILRGEAIPAWGDTGISQRRDDRPYSVINGVALVEVAGLLVHAAPDWMAGEFTTYGSIANQVQQAVDDPEVRAVAMVINSPGGEVSGAFDAADVIAGLRGTKAIWSICDDSALSSAYALASCADIITIPRTGNVGSIGVVALHVDCTGALDQQGIKISVVQFGARKTDLYPTSVLSDTARERLQRDVDSIGEMFVGLIAANRGLDPQLIIQTEAATFLGADGVDAGLADAVMSPAQAFEALCAEIGE